MATSNGSSGDDTISGSTGADNLNGGAGSDTLDGGAGSDRLNGGSGADLLIYRLCENTGAGDVYTGGSGIDTIQLTLTSTEWLKDSVQSELARYFAHLATVQTNIQGEVSNGSSRDFTFNFGYSTTLTVQMMEKLKIVVDGEEITDLDKPIVDLPDSTVLGSAIEDTSLSATGTIKFFDLDIVDTHTVTVTPPAGAIGTLTAVITDVATGDGQGTVGWTYTLDNAAAQYLDDGESKVEEFVVKILDDEGQFVTQTVTITINGTNDAPVITVGAGDSAAETLLETNAGLAVSDTLTVVDADLSDAVTASVQSVSTVGPTGGLTNGQLLAMLSVTLGSIAADAGAANNLAWSFNSGTQTFDYLDDGESLELTYTVRATDDSLVSDDQTVTITINGTNDAPVITVGAGDSAAETLLETNAGLAVSDTLTVVDADLSDAVTASVQSVSTVGPTGGLTNGQLLAMLSVTLGSIAADAGAANNLAWSFNSGTQTFDYLDDGESLELTYTVRATDDSLVSDDQTVTITINGTNDAPMITVGAGDSAAETLLETNAGLAVSDTLTVVDADLSDAVTASVQSVSTVGPTGGLTNGQLLAMLSVTLGSIAADAGAANNLAWSFNSGTQTFDYLDDGESLELTYTVRATDDSLVSDDQTVTITINGTNDAPMITVGAGDSAAETLLETNAGLAVSDTLTVVDADLSDAVTASVQSVSTVGPTGGLTNGQLLAMLSVTLGSIAADAGAANNLAWSFNSGTQTFDYLDDGESLELTYTVRATDDSLVSDDQTVTITINGTNDAPMITVGAGDSAAETLLETNAGLAVSDTLTVVDADLSDAVTASVQSVSTVGPTGGLTNGQLLAMLSVTLGSIAADAGAANNLAWSFNSGTQTFDYLDDGESLELTYTVRATDDSLVSDDQTVTITINGTDDRTAPTDIRLIVDSPLVDQSTMQFSISGTLVATDADPGSFTYTLLSQSPTGGSAATFSITDDNLFSGGNLGQLQTYRLAIEATQADDPAGMSYTEIFTIITGRNGPQGDSLSDPTVPIAGDDDVLFGGDGNDILLGGNGDDTLFGHASTDSSPGDTLQGGAGNDTLYGGSGLDAIDTGTGNDVVAVNATVGSGSDSTRVTVVGNGNDTGQDTVTGFDMAADTLRIVGTGVTNFVHGTDTAIGTAVAVNDGTAGSFTTLTGLIELNQTANNNWTDSGDVAVTFAAPLGAFTEASFEARLQYNLTGTSAANTITGGELDDTLSGAGGDDTLTGAGGNDILIGGAGNDILVGGAGNDTFRWANTSEGMDSLNFTLGNLDPGNGALSANADVLDLSDVLGGVGALVTAVNADDSATVDDYISFAVAGTTATLRVDSDGLGGGSPIALATFAVTLGTTASSLLGELLDNNQIAV